MSIFASELSAEKIAQLAAGVSPMEVAEPIALPISFTLEPVSKVGQQSRPVTFTCLIEGSPTRVIGYQWFRDDVAIPGANGTDYTIDSAQLTDSGAQFRVEAFNLNGTPDRAFLFEQGGTTRGLSIYLSGTETADPQTAEIHFHAWNDNADAAASPWGGPESEGKTPIVIIGTVERGRTYQAVLVMDGDNAGTTGDLRAYLDGVEVGSQTGVGLFFNAGDDAGIGAINQNSVFKEDNRGVTYGDPFNGLIAEAGLSDPAVTSPNTENFSVEVITYLDLEPGVVRLGVNCDDGFRLTAGRVPGETTLIVAGRDRTGGITDERPQFPALFKVTKAGVYAFRMVYFQGNGGAGLEWHVKDGAGLSFLLNDSGSPIPAYRSRTEDPPDIVEPATLGITSDGVNAVIRFATTAGVTYEVQATETLNPPAWTAVETLLGDGAAATVTDTLGDATRFYRVESK